MFLAIAATARAQTTQYRAQIPFDFRIGQKSYKAGEYSNGLLSRDSQSRIIFLRDANGRNSRAFSSAPVGFDSKTATMFFFNRGNREYFSSKSLLPPFAPLCSSRKPDESSLKTSSLQAKRKRFQEENKRLSEHLLYGQRFLFND